MTDELKSTLVVTVRELDRRDGGWAEIAKQYEYAVADVEDATVNFGVLHITFKNGNEKMFSLAYLENTETKLS